MTTQMQETAVQQAVDDAERIHELLCELIDDANSPTRMHRVSALFRRIVKLVHESKLKAQAGRTNGSWVSRLGTPFRF